MKITDKQRLNWLQKHTFPFWIGVARKSKHEGLGCSLSAYPNFMEPAEKVKIKLTIREAIDRAIKIFKKDLL